jgi:restriction endonuclease S subunit
MIDVVEQPDTERTLPEGWRSVKLEDICMFLSGGTPSKADSTYWQGDIPWVSPKDMKSRYINDAADYISKEALASSATRLVSPGTLLCVTRSGILAHTFPVGLVQTAVAFNQDIRAIVPTDQVDSLYLLWILKAKESYILEHGVKKGPTVHSLISGFLEQLMIPLPPLAEQHRIARILTEQLAEVEQSRAAAEAQLTAAQELSSIYLRQVLEDNKTYKWEQCLVHELCSNIDYGYTASADFTISEPKFLRITDIQDGRVNWESVPGCAISDKEERSNRLLTGDIVFARTGATTGKSFLIVNPPRAVFASYLIRLRPNERVSSKYLYTFFQSASYWNQIREQARGAAQPNVNATILGNLRVPLPPPQEQSKITQMYEVVISETQQLISSIKTQINTINDLPAALLRQAFSGAL